MKEPGIYADIPLAEYHADEGISASGVNLLLDCPRRYYHRYIARSQPESRISEALTIGSAVHLFALEPEKFDSAYIVQRHSIDRRTKEGKAQYAEFLSEAKGRTVLSLEDFERISGMADSLMEHQVFKRFPEGLVEQSVYWDWESWGTSKIRFRSRPDYFTDEIIIDIKTTASLKGFDRSVFRWGYHRQAAMQLDGLNNFDARKRMYVLAVVEKEPPYLTNCYTLDDPAIDKGRSDYLKAAEIYLDCCEFDSWPGYSNNVQLITLPESLQQEEQDDE